MIDFENDCDKFSLHSGEDDFQLMPFAEFKDFAKNNIKIEMKPYSRKEFVEMLKPFICDLCHRLFNPTEEEKEQAVKTMQEIDVSDFTWEVILKK